MVGAQASRTVLKIRYKSFLVYLKTAEVVGGTIRMGSFASRGPIGWLDNLFPDSEGDREKSERAIEKRSQRGCPQP